MRFFNTFSLARLFNNVKQHIGKGFLISFSLSSIVCVVKITM